MSINSNGYYTPDKLYEDNQATLYADFSINIRENQEQPKSRGSILCLIGHGEWYR
jgi:hypothetical protein